MSLKSKIEAVIYACEEPVTLAQLVGTLGIEAEHELAQIAARQHTLHLAESPNDAEEGGDEPAELTIEETVDAAAEGETEAAPETAAEKKAAREKDRRTREYLKELADSLIADYAASDRGIEVREVAGGYRMATKAEYHDTVRGFVKSLKPVLKLSLQALETLAVVAYKQPVTAPEISEIRGVDSGGVLGSLMARKLITTAGRKQVIGRPILYKTTKDFLMRFGLKDVSELPSIEEFEKMAGELADQEEIPMSEQSDVAEERITHEDLEEQKHVTAPQADGNNAGLNSVDGPTGDRSDRSANELSAVDGRISGLPPAYDKADEDPSATEAAVRNGGGD